MKESGTSESEYEPSEGEDTEDETENDSEDEEDKAEKDSVEDVTDRSTDVSLVLHASFNVPRNSACDDIELKADLSKGPKGEDKASYGLYCGKSQKKFPRHLASKHFKEKEVSDFLELSKDQKIYKEMQQLQIFEKKEISFLMLTQRKMVEN